MRTMSDLALLGGLAPAAFLARHWHKRAHLVRAAIAGFVPPVDLPALQRLAARDDVESRIVVRTGGKWALHHGPFGPRVWRTLPEKRWTLLVQGVNLHVDAVDRLMRRFAFVPHARLDDVMISYAAPGGGVGPHFDSYDVFLLQASGWRRWRYGAQRDLAVRPGLPLRILARFTPDAEAVLAPGDMLYLPPHVAHDGVAVDACTTYSIGFRAPAASELVTEFFTRLADDVDLAGRYADPRLAATRAPGRVPSDLVDYACDAIARVKWSRDDVAQFVGAHASTPKANVVFDAPDRPLAPAAFARAATRRGVVLDPRTILLYDARRFYINGEVTTADAPSAQVLRRLADRRGLDADALRSPGASLVRRLHDWHRSGFLHIAPP